jgi:hypothetical protein
MRRSASANCLLRLPEVVSCLLIWGCFQIQACALAQPAAEIQRDDVHAVLHRRPACVHREDDVNCGDEGRSRVRPSFFAFPSKADTHSLSPTRALISNFEFEPAYEGQVPQPTAAVTMSASLCVCFGGVSDLYFSFDVLR